MQNTKRSNASINPTRPVWIRTTKCNYRATGIFEKKEKREENSDDASFTARRVSANSFVAINQHTSCILVIFAKYIRQIDIIFIHAGTE